MSPRVWLLLVGLVILGGCVVPKSRYDQLKKENERLSKLLDDTSKKLDESEAANENLKTRLATLQSQLDQVKESLANAKAGKEDAEEAAKAAKAALARIQDELDRLNKEKDALAKKNEELSKAVKELSEIPGVKMVGPFTLEISEDLLFDLGKADIKPKGKAALDEFVKRFKARTELIMIDGHTDNVPVKKPETVKAFRDNEGLGAARALAVLRYIRDKGVAGKRLFIRSFGEWRPRYPNDNAANREKNRRVEVSFIPTNVPEDVIVPPAAPAKAGAKAGMTVPATEEATPAAGEAKPAEGTEKQPTENKAEEGTEEEGTEETEE